MKRVDPQQPVDRANYQTAQHLFVVHAAHLFLPLIEFSEFLVCEWIHYIELSASRIKV